MSSMRKKKLLLKVFAFSSMIVLMQGKFMNCLCKIYMINNL